jgi:hypothetical protein
MPETRTVLTDDQCAFLERMERAFSLTRNDMTPWEEKFLGDVLLRFRKYGDRTLVSRTQWEILTRISEKII